MQTVQNTLLAFFKKNRYSAPIVAYAGILAIIYPIFAVLANITPLNVLWNPIGMISSVLVIAYYIGTIISFAKNDVLMLSVAFGCRALDEIIGFIMNLARSFDSDSSTVSYFTLNTFVYLAFYIFLAVICIKALMSTPQWSQLKQNVQAQQAQARAASAPAQVVCPKCGNVCSADTKFCNSCGNQLRS